MIRRNIQQSDGSPAWLLISQIEHARVAGELARHWQWSPQTTLPYDKVIVPTVFHHDDGWDQWEAHPTIDSIHGRPRAFTEMPNPLAHNIWRRSIDMVAPLGPLAQYMVAQHFMRLRRGGDETEQRDVQAFLSEYDARCFDWLAQWTRENENVNTLEGAELAVELLQMFDMLSLLLCCTPSGKPHQIASPDEKLRLSIDEGQVANVTVHPWPWTASDLSIHASGRLIPAERLANDEELRDRLSDAPLIDLFWHLLPGLPGNGQ